MSFISPLDNFTSSHLGEKGTIEYTWSNSIQELILQLNFQLIRTNDTNIIKNLSVITDKILTEIISSYQSNIISREEYLDYMSIMYRIIGYTRDIISGKGEYILSFMLLEVWHNHFPQLTYFAFKQFVIPPDDQPHFHPYGSWKDIKYLFLYLHNNSYINNTSLLIDYSIQLVFEQLNKDLNSTHPSLLCKWIPREKTKFGKLFSRIASYYYTNNLSKERSILKAKIHLRKIISNLNKKLETVQIKQCSNQWSEIDPFQITSITFSKQKRAFLNIDYNEQLRYDNNDRIICSNNFKENAFNHPTTIKGKRLGLNYFTEQAIRLFNKKNSYEAHILNSQWIDNSNLNNNIGYFIPILDLSNIDNKDSFNASISLAIRISEKSSFYKRILTFSANPSWINLEQTNNFIEMVEQVIHYSNCGLNTNFSTALNLIIDTIISQKLKHEEVHNMILAIISDMQIDDISSKYKSLIEYIEIQFSEAGKKLWNKPFKQPHILFWNIRSTSGFPALSINNNCSMVSGFNPLILNHFVEKKTKGNDKFTPWSFLKKELNNPRYDILEQYLRQNI